jgi:hypothetical protein
MWYPNCEKGLGRMLAWFGARHRREPFLSTVTLAELRRGVALISHRDPAQSGPFSNPRRLVFPV